MKRTLIIVLAVVLAFSVVLISCKKEEAKPVKIGALIPLTGPLAVLSDWLTEHHLQPAFLAHSHIFHISR